MVLLNRMLSSDVEMAVSVTNISDSDDICMFMSFILRFHLHFEHISNLKLIF